MAFNICSEDLYLGGWRAKDKQQLVECYELTEEDADEIVKELAEIQRKKTLEWITSGVKESMNKRS